MHTKSQLIYKQNTMTYSWKNIGASRRALLFASFAALLSLCFSVALQGSASAEPQAVSNIDQIVAHCKEVMPKKADGGCTEDNARKARNVATYHVDDSKSAINSGKTARQIVSRANSYMDEAKQKNPSSAKDLTQKLETVLKSKGGSLNKPKDSTNNGADADSTNNANCDPANGLCADCQNGGKGCIDCDNGICNDPAANASAECTNNGCDLVKKYVNPFIQLLTLVFGLIAIISIIIGGIQYATSEGDPQRVSKAKMRILWTVIAIVGYFFMYGFLQFLIPGGIF
jgi:hypothetical protein